MALLNIVNLHEIQNRIRIEAEFYRPDYVECYKTIERLPHLKLRQNSLKISDGTHFTPRYTESGIRFYSAVNVKENVFAYDEAHKFISHQEHLAIHKRCPVDAGDILIRKVGVGPRWSCVVPEGLEQFSIFVSVALVRPGRRLRPHYLSTFINSRYGQLQLLRLNKGISQPDLHLEDIGELIVPDFGEEIQQEISETVLKAETVRENSKKLYTQAQLLLESELGLDKLRFDKPVGYTARFSELESSLRFDPEHFYPTFKALCAGLPETVSLEPLYRFAQPLKTGIQPVYLEDGEYEVINSKHIGVNKIDLSALRRAASAPYSVMADNGDVLLNATGRGTLGRCAVLESDTPRIFDVCIIRIRPVGIDPYFLSALLNTRFGQLQMELHTRGTSGQLHLYPRDARKIQIWPAPESLQTKIRELMIKAARAAQEAKQLLDQAKSRVEQLIEEAVRA